jgi:hypothetical protein
VNRDLIISHLEVAEDHLANGARQLSKQRSFISRLQHGGENTTDAIHPGAGHRGLDLRLAACKTSGKHTEAPIAVGLRVCVAVIA